MEQLRINNNKKRSYTSLEFERSLMHKINWKDRLIGIKGSRGVGKTTLLLQYLKQNYANSDDALYVSLDNIWFSNNRLVSLADTFSKLGGKLLLLDEVHKYPDWPIEIKNIYDDYPELKVVFTGSSLLEILNARADLSRRAIVYQMQGLSFREYLNYSLGLSLEKFTLENILSNHSEIAQNIVSQIKPFKYFKDYLNLGYFPFFKENTELYHLRLQEIIQMILEIELPLLRGIEIGYSRKLMQLLNVIAESAPFIPNVSKLSEKIGINRQTLLHYLHDLNDAGLINTLFKDSFGISKLQKPNKIFLENTNYAFAINFKYQNLGNLRETFFLNQVSNSHLVTYPEKADFLIDNEILFEIGGKNKSANTNSYKTKNFFFAIDDIEIGFANRIPLWLFGFLY